MDITQRKSTPTDIVPKNAPARFNFCLAGIRQTRLPGWPPKADMILLDAEREIRKYWDFLSGRQIWSPYPILSYCLGAATYRGSELFARYFLFPCENPSVQNQAVAQLVCMVNPGVGSTNVSLLIDALREDELEEININDIGSALNASSISQIKPSAVHYERAMEAIDSNRLDVAIRELDECLCSRPESLLAMEAYYNLSATIWEKFRFNERRGADISDDEFDWVQACNLCLRRALKIYEGLPRNRQLEAGVIQLHQAIKGSLSPTISYGSIVYKYGQREWRKVKGLPTVRCLTDVQMAVD